MQGLTPICWHYVLIFVNSFDWFRYSYSLTFCQLKHLQSLSVIKSNTQRNEGPLYCTCRLCKSGHEDLVMLNLIIRGFIVALDILPLSKSEGKQQVETLFFLHSYGLSSLCLFQTTITPITAHWDWSSDFKFKLYQGTPGHEEYTLDLCCPMPPTEFGHMDATGVSVWDTPNQFHHTIPIVGQQSSFCWTWYIPRPWWGPPNDHHKIREQVLHWRQQGRLLENEQDNVHLYVSISRSHDYLLLNPYQHWTHCTTSYLTRPAGWIGSWVYRHSHRKGKVVVKVEIFFYMCTQHIPPRHKLTHMLWAGMTFSPFCIHNTYRNSTPPFHSYPNLPENWRCRATLPMRGRVTKETQWMRVTRFMNKYHPHIVGTTVLGSC